MPGVYIFIVAMRSVLLKSSLLLLIVVLVSTGLSAQQIISMAGHWTQKGNSNDFGFKAKLTIDTSNNVDGVITWSVIRVKSATVRYYSARMKSTAREYVKGTYAPASKSLQFHGVRKNDPDKIVSMDSYDINLTSDNRVVGKSKGNKGLWDGIMSGNYTVMKSQIKRHSANRK